MMPQARKPAAESVLIVEDDATMLRALKDNFEYDGYRVATAGAGEGYLFASESWVRSQSSISGIRPVARAMQESAAP